MMRLSHIDLSLFLKVVKNKLSGLGGAYVDDSISVRRESEKTQKRFESTDREYDTFRFAGMEIASVADAFKIHHRECTLNLLPL